VLIHDWDEGGEQEWRAFLTTHGFGELVAGGRGRDVPVVVPTQFVLKDTEVLVHLLERNPIWAAIEENPNVLLAVSGDWAYIPSDWKTVGAEDPALGIPTTYYASVQLTGTAAVVADPEGVAEVLRSQLLALQPGTEVVDPLEHGPKLRAIVAMRVQITSVRAKFKYGGNVDAEHRLAVVDRLNRRNGPGDAAAAAHVSSHQSQEERRGTFRP
jgi:transcriptional regulator